MIPVRKKPDPVVLEQNVEKCKFFNRNNNNNNNNNNDHSNNGKNCVDVKIMIMILDRKMIMMTIVTATIMMIKTFQSLFEIKQLSENPTHTMSLSLLFLKTLHSLLSDLL